MANTLLVFNRNTYDGTDITWNGLRLADQLLNTGLEVNIFLMNELAQWIKEANKVISFGGFNSQVQLSQILFYYPVNFLRS